MRIVSVIAMVAGLSGALCAIQASGQQARKVVQVAYPGAAVAVVAGSAKCRSGNASLTGACK